MPIGIPLVERGSNSDQLRTKTHRVVIIISCDDLGLFSQRNLEWDSVKSAQITQESIDIHVIWNMRTHL